MKKLCFGTALLAIFALVGCEKEQSQVTLDVMTGQATVQGKVLYDAGYTEKDGVVIEKNIVAREGVEVILRIPYASYSDDAEGKQEIKTTTDAEGKYTFTVKVGKKALQNASVEVVPFVAAKGFPVDGKVMTVENALFDQGVDPQSLTIEESKILVRNFDIASTDELDKYKVSGEKKFKVMGMVKLEGGSRWKDVNDLSAGVKENAPAAPQGTKVKITLQNTIDADAPILTYEAQTDENGAYTLEAKVVDVWSYNDIEVEVKVVPFYVNSDNAIFVNSFFSSEDTSRGLTERIPGIYKESSSVKQVTDGELVVELGLTFADIKMPFVADDCKIKGLSYVKYGNKDDGYTYTSATGTVYSSWFTAKNTAGKYNDYE